MRGYFGRKPFDSCSCHAKELNDHAAIKDGRLEAWTCVQPSVSKALVSVRTVSPGDLSC